jgi:hypothetical protein
MRTQDFDLRHRDVIDGDDVLANHPLTAKDRTFLHKLGIRQRGYFNYDPLRIRELDDWFLRSAGSVKELAQYLDRQERIGYRLRVADYVSILRDIRSEAHGQTRRTIKEHVYFLCSLSRRGDLVPSSLVYELAKETRI